MQEQERREFKGAGPRGKLSRAQRKMLGGRYKKQKRKPIDVEVMMENGRFYRTWMHPTKGKRKLRMTPNEIADIEARLRAREALEKSVEQADAVQEVSSAG